MFNCLLIFLVALALSWWIHKVFVDVILRVALHSLDQSTVLHVEKLSVKVVVLSSATVAVCHSPQFQRHDGL